jgi:hypothetical protein
MEPATKPQIQTFVDRFIQRFRRSNKAHREDFEQMVPEEILKLNPTLGALELSHIQWSRTGNGFLPYLTDLQKVLKCSEEVIDGFNDRMLEYKANYEQGKQMFAKRTAA